MSDQHIGFSERVDQRIREVVEEELAKSGRGGMMTGFLGIITYIDEDGDQCWARAGEVPIITAVGMAETLSMSVGAEVHNRMGFGHE
jgi:hypothetical protein